MHLSIIATLLVTGPLPLLTFAAPVADNTISNLNFNTTADEPPRPGPSIGGFNLASANVCPIPDFSDISMHINIGYGEACGKCVPVRDTRNNMAYVAIQDAYLNPYCQIIIHQRSDCGDPGIDSGSGCWSPEGGISGYRVHCPWWPVTDTKETLLPCYN